MPALLAASSAPNDRALEHSLTYALIEIADPGSTAAGLKSEDPRILRTAVVAIDQMDGGRLEPAKVAELARFGRPRAQGNRLVDRGPASANGPAPSRTSSAAGSIGPTCPASERTELEKQLGRLAQAAPIQDLLADRLNNASAPRAARQSSLQAMAWSGLNEKQVPASWILGLATTLDQKPARCRAPSPCGRSRSRLPLPQARAGQLVTPLLRIASDSRNPDDLRLSALAAFPVA